MVKNSLNRINKNCNTTATKYNKVYHKVKVISFYNKSVPTKLKLIVIKR